MRKIVRSPEGILAGAAGAVSSITPFLAWCEKGMKTRGKPDLSGDGDFSGLVIRPDGTILMYESGMVPLRVTADYHAIGTGMHMAIGAMAAGADAVRAVKIVCRFVTDCQEPVQAIRLNGELHELDPDNLQLD